MGCCSPRKIEALAAGCRSYSNIRTTDVTGPYAADGELPGMVRHASWLPAVRAGEWTDAQTGVHSNLRGPEGVKVHTDRVATPNINPLKSIGYMTLSEASVTRSRCFAETPKSDRAHFSY